MFWQLIWMFLMLETLPNVSGRCRSGLEPLGEFMNSMEHQMDRIMEITNDVCKHCSECPHGCFRDLMSALKHDIDDLRIEENKLIDLFLESECSYHETTVVAGPSDGPIRVFSQSENTSLPILDTWGLSYDARTDMIAYTNLFELFTTDSAGNSPILLDANTPPAFMTSPRILDGDTIYYSTYIGDIYKSSGGVIMQIVSSTDNPDGIYDIALDSVDGFVYWSAGMANLDTLKRATLSGDNIETVHSDPRQIVALDLEPSTRMLYYVTMEPMVLVRYDLRTMEATDITPLTQMATDISICVNKIYLGLNGDAKFQVRSLDGTILEEEGGFGWLDFMGISTSNTVP